jgi:hypothetical protein
MGSITSLLSDIRVLQNFKMSHKRGTTTSTAPPIRISERSRNRNHQTQDRVPSQTQAPARQRHTDTTYYSVEDTSSQHSNNPIYNYDNHYSEQPSTQWEEFSQAQRAPSAHISELDSVDDGQMGSQGQYGGMEYEDLEPDNRLIPAPKSSYQGDRVNFESSQDDFEEVSLNVLFGDALN